MQKYITLFFSVLLCLTACQTNEVPAGVIKPPQMIALLTDVHVTDGEIYTVPQIPDSMYKYASAKYAAVFKKHHTTDAAFKRSLHYYTTQPELLQDMYIKIDALIKARLDSTTKAPKSSGSQSPAPQPAGARPAPPQADTARHARPDLHKRLLKRSKNAVSPK